MDYWITPLNCSLRMAVWLQFKVPTVFFFKFYLFYEAQVVLQ